jgi:hypothetical protein
MYSEKMNRILTVSLSFILLFLNLFVLVHAGLMVQEGSIELKAMERKKVCGIACVFSVYENPSTYSIVISDNLNKFVDNIEPSTFTLNGIECPSESKARRECIANLCNDPNSTSTKMPCIYFSGPLELSFDVCNGLPCNSKMQKYEGSLRAIGTIGTAQTVEPLSFIVYYTPISGWPFLIGVIILVIIIIFFVLRKIKKVKKIVMFCKKCNKKYKKNISFCQKCGSSLVKKEK